MADTRKPMTDGERQVWASTYAILYVRGMDNVSNFTRGSSTSAEYDRRRNEGERAARCGAIEGASCAVRYLRDAAEEVRDGWNESSETYQMLQEMLES